MEAATQNALLLLSLTVRVVKLNHASLICLAATMAERQRLKMGMAGWPAWVAAAFVHWTRKPEARDFTLNPLRGQKIIQKIDRALVSGLQPTCPGYAPLIGLTTASASPPNSSTPAACTRSGSICVMAFRPASPPPAGCAFLSISALLLRAPGSHLLPPHCQCRCLSLSSFSSENVFKKAFLHISPFGFLSRSPAYNS